QENPGGSKRQGPRSRRARSALQDVRRSESRLHRARAQPRRPGRDGADEPAARRRRARRERHAGVRALRRQDALAPAPRHAAQRDRSLRAPAPARLDRGREQRRRSADAQLPPPPYRAAARAEVSALEGEPRARRAAFLEEGSGRRRAAAPLPSFKGAPSAERSEAHRDAEAARLGQPAREARARRCDAADLPRQGISRRRAVVRILAAAMERPAAPEAARARRRAALSQGARQRHRARAQVLERAPALRRRAPPARPQAPAPHSEEPLSGSRHPALGARAPSLAIQWRGPGLGPRPRYRRALPSVARLTGSGARMALPLCSKAHRRNTLLRVKSGTTR